MQLLQPPVTRSCCFCCCCCFCCFCSQCRSAAVFIAHLKLGLVRLQLHPYCYDHYCDHYLLYHNFYRILPQLLLVPLPHCHCRHSDCYHLLLATTLTPLSHHSLTRHHLGTVLIAGEPELPLTLPGGDGRGSAGRRGGVAGGGEPGAGAALAHPPQRCPAEPGGTTAAGTGRLKLDAICLSLLSLQPLYLLL